MSEKKMNARILHKHDTEVHWNRAAGFIPREGELIIYDVDESYSQPRFKVGNGETVAKDLPFATVEGVEFKDNLMNIPLKENYDESGVIGLGTYKYTVQSGNDLIFKVEDGYDGYAAPLLSMRATGRSVGPDFEVTLGDDASEYSDQISGGTPSMFTTITNIKGTEIKIIPSSYDPDAGAMLSPTDPAIRVSGGNGISYIDISGSNIDIKVNAAGQSADAIIISTIEESDDYGNITGIHAKTEVSGELLYNNKEVATKDDVKVTSVNGKTGAVTLNALDIGAVAIHNEGNIAITSKDAYNYFNNNILSFTDNSEVDANYNITLGGVSTLTNTGGIVGISIEGTDINICPASKIEGSSTPYETAPAISVTASTEYSETESKEIIKPTTNINGELYYNNKEVATKEDLENIDIPEVNLDNVMLKNGEVDSLDIRFKDMYTEGDAYSIIQTPGDGIVFGYDGGSALVGDRETVVSGRHTTIQVVDEDPVLGTLYCPAINVVVDPETTESGDPSTITRISGQLLYNEEEVATKADLENIDITTYAYISEDTTSKSLIISADKIKSGNNTVTGTGSVAFGSGNTVSGDAAFATGAGTQATDHYSHAEGYQTKALKGYCHAEGVGSEASNTAAHAEGKNTIASGLHSHAEGYHTTASGGNAHAEGGRTVASGNNSHAEGEHTTAKGNYSHAEGNYTEVYGDRSHIEGFSGAKASSVISGLSQSTSEDTIKSAWANNKFALVLSNNSHGEGRDNLVLGAFSHAEGRNTIAGSDANSAWYAHAEGKDTKALGNASHAEGLKAEATGAVSHAEGSQTIASGDWSHAEGALTEARGDYSHASGTGTIAKEMAQFVCGAYNADDSNALFIVGAAQSDLSRANCFSTGRQRSDGEAYIKIGNIAITETQLNALLDLITPEITFYINEIEHTVKEGTTWGELLAAHDNHLVSGEYIISLASGSVVYSDGQIELGSVYTDYNEGLGTPISSSDEIINNHVYVLS